MKPCDDVLVTVLVSGKSVDMELPAFMPIKELRVKMCETFQTLYSGMRISVNDMSLFCDGAELPGDGCLASCGIWDGSIVEYVCRREE